jgi:hypothetical protein
MHMFGRRGIAGHAARTVAATGAVSAVLFGMASFAPPASAKPTGVTYQATAILSGMSLRHSYQRAGSRAWHREPLTQPDDITEFGGDLFTTFQNGVGPQGQAAADGNRDSTIVEFTLNGTVINQWDLRGKCDGLTADPATGIVYATINEDAHSSLDAIDPVTNQVTHYSYNKNPLPHNGGTDAIEFYNGLMLISASAPGTVGAAAPEPYYPAVYVVTPDPANDVAYVKALFYDEAHATAANGQHAGHTVELALTDPDSNEDVPADAPRFAGDFMLTSQGDKEQIFVQGAGTPFQHLWVLRISNSVDDTAWASTPFGAFYTASHDLDTIDRISSFSWPTGTVLTAVTPCDANNAPATCPGPGFPPNYVGTENMVTGQLTALPLNGARVEPQGMIFVPGVV